MAFNVDLFKSAGLIYGGARPSLFQVDMTFPFEISTGGGVVSQRFTFTCRASSIPASVVDSINVPYFGRQIKVAGDRTFQDWTVTVMNDEDYVVRDTFEAWSNAMNTMAGNKRAISAGNGTVGSGYKVDAYITHFGKGGAYGSASTGEDTVIKQYQFVGLFPVDVAAMALDWETTNQIQTFDVVFAYDYWVPLPASGVTIRVD